MLAKKWIWEQSFRITTNLYISYEFDFDFTTSFWLVRAILAQKPATSWWQPTSIACIVKEDSVGRVYPIFVSLFKHAMTAYLVAIFLSCTFLPTSKICTTHVPLLAAMKKLTQHCINRPLSTSKHSTSTPSTLKFESVSSSQRIGSITYGIFKKHIYTYQKIILCTSIFKTY